MSAIATAIRRIVAQIPQGKVATYGQIARLAGYPRHARFVGQCLHDTPVPWQRVINGQGKVSPRGLDGNDDEQRFLLQCEGIEFDEAGKINLKVYLWDGE
ncbi:MAG: MGMT family protein [Iodobacter sp.]